MQTYGRVITGISFTSPDGGGGGGGITNVTLDNSLFVSKDGNDTTAQPYSLVNQYLTIQAAINDAASGETVFVYPGTYTENLTISGGIRVHFFLGAIVSGQIDMDGGTNYITGNGQFTYTGAGHCLHIFGGASSVNMVECFSVESGTGANGHAIRKTGAGFGQVNCQRVIARATLTGPAVQVTAGTLHLYANAIQATAGFAGTDLVKLESTTLLECDQIVQSGGGARAIYSTGGNNRIYFNLVVGYVQVDGTASIDIRGFGAIGAIKTNPGTTSIAPLVLSGTTSSTKIGNLMLAVEGTTGNAAIYSAASQTVVLNGIIASNKTLGANVSYTGSGVFVVDPNMDTGNP